MNQVPGMNAFWKIAMNQVSWMKPLQLSPLLVKPSHQKKPAKRPMERIQKSTWRVQKKPFPLSPQDLLLLGRPLLYLHWVHLSCCVMSSKPWTVTMPQHKDHVNHSARATQARLQLWLLIILDMREASSCVVPDFLWLLESVQ